MKKTWKRKLKKIKGLCVWLAVGIIAYFALSEFAPSLLGDAVGDVEEMIDDANDSINTFTDVIGVLSNEAKEELKATLTPTPTISVPTEYDDAGTLVRVVDGDTFVLNLDGVETTFRLIGVDTPESVAPDTYGKENTEEGKTVSELMTQKVPVGSVVYIEYDVSKTDKYGRNLAYLYLLDKTMLQEWLLENGFAMCATIQPNSKYADRFAEIQREAEANKTGLWNGFFES